MKLLVTLCILLTQLYSATPLCWTEGQYKMCQTQGETAFLQRPRTKIAFNVSSGNPNFRSNLRLHVRFDSSTILEEGTFEEEGFRCSVIYNTCTDSDKPRVLCREAQITFWGDVPYETVSFHLYRGISQVRMLSNLSLEHQPTEGTQTPATTIPDTTNSPTSADITNGPGAINAQGAASTKGVPYPFDVIACVLAAVFLVLLTATVVTLIITCKTRKAKSQTKTEGDQTV